MFGNKNTYITQSLCPVKIRFTLPRYVPVPGVYVLSGLGRPSDGWDTKYNVYVLTSERRVRGFWSRAIS